MSYIGRDVDNISNVEKLDNITFDGSATYALEKSSVAYTPSGANNILISIDGVVQQGNFSVSTTNIVFDWSPTSSNTNNFILHYGTGVLNVPADGSIVAAKMAANSVDSDAYVDGSIDTAHIDALQVTGAKLNTDVISAQTELAAEPADTDEFMVSDGGVLKRIDYSLIKGGGGKILQVVNTETGAVASGTTTLPYDDTIPQITEGFEVMTLAVTPTSATNKLLINVVTSLATNINSLPVTALFEGTTANALACVFSYSFPDGVNNPIVHNFNHYMTSGSTSELTFRVRIGMNQEGTVTFNGRSAARKYGGVSASSITIMEIEV